MKPLYTYHKDVCCVWKLPSSSEQLLKIIELVREETVYHRMIKTQATWSKTMHDIQSYWVLQYQLWSSTQWRKKQCITDTSNLNCNTVVMYFSLSPCQSDANTFFPVIARSFNDCLEKNWSSDKYLYLHVHVFRHHCLCLLWRCFLRNFSIDTIYAQ